MQTKRILFLCGFLDMLLFEETRLLIELQKKRLTKKKQKTDSRSHTFFGPKTCNCKICLSNLAERMVSNKFQEILPKLPDKLLSFVMQGKKTLFQIDYILVTLIWHIPLFKEGKRVLFSLHVVLLSQLNISWLSVLIC